MRKILLTLSLLVTSLTQAQVKQYDVNNNNVANIGDITTVIKALNNEGSADVNRDSNTDIKDVNSIAHYMLHNINGYDFVDLGLPSGTLWATCNVGATKPEEFGHYFAWGETETKEEYNWNTYKYTNDGGKTFTKYNTNSKYGEVDNKTTLDAEDDAATQKWEANGWKMPTKNDINELRNENNCTWTKQTINGVIGFIVTSTKNKNSIFLPLGGYYDGIKKISEGSSGCYWSSSLNTSSVWTAHNMVIDNSNFSFCNLRFYGRNIRPVLKLQN